MDCDRLDFLSRDRYHTGIRSSTLDLDWLFDSLRIEQVPLDALNGVKAYSFVVLPKGVSAAEEFVISYVRMYQNIYFHKTTRAVQHLVRDAVSAILKLQLGKGDPLRTHPLARFFANKKRSLDDYLSLDDASIISLVQIAANGNYGDATQLSKRYLKRDLYKCIEFPKGESGGVSHTHVARFIDGLKMEGIEYIPDLIPPKNYKQYDVLESSFVKNILVKMGTDYVPLGNVSDAVRTLPGKTVRVYFKDEDTRQKAKAIFEKCR